MSDYLYEVSYSGSFIGKCLQSEQLISTLSDAARGYIKGLVDCQKGHYEALFIRNHIPQYVLNELKEHCPLPNEYASYQSESDAYIQYILFPMIQFEDKKLIFQYVSSENTLEFFNLDCDISLPNSVNHSGYVMNPEEIYRQSMINIIIPDRQINPALSEQAITAMLMGCFVLLPYSSIYEQFFSLEDIVFFRNQQDALTKVSYYKEHKTECYEQALRSQAAVQKLLSNY